MRSVLLALTFLVGCSSSEATNDPSPVDSAVAVDSAMADTASVTDSGSEETSTDASTTETSIDATSEDVAVDAAGDAMTCEYADVDDVVVKCSGKYGLLGRFDVVPSSAACPPYWTFGGKSPHYETKEAAIAGQGCDATCVYTFATAVTRLYCGYKSGYETLKADGCPDLYRFPEGYYESVAAHDAANPCM